MKKIINILHLEESKNDSELIRSILDSGEISFRYFMVDNQQDYKNALKDGKIDIVLSDYSLPGYNGNEALSVVRKNYSKMPFIFVSGAMGEDVAINSLLNGATDYVLKNRLERLVPAIHRAMHEFELECIRLESEAILKEKNEQIKLQNDRFIEINKELVFQNEEKEKRADELFLANEELAFQIQEKVNKAEELRIANKELVYQYELIEKSKQLTELNQRLEEAKLEAETANKAKSAFLANMSHEIRTPMNAVLGFSELLSDLVSDPKAKNYLQAIQTSGKTLHNLINDILDFSKLEAGMLEVKTEVIDIRQLILEIKYLFSLKIQEKGLLFIVEFVHYIPLKLHLDEHRIRQILINLVGNAIKFTDNGFIKIIVNYKKVNEKIGNLEILVEDSGIGIPIESLEKIFDVFQQQDMQDTKKYGGTGLGLSISAKLASIMNGRIALESKIGEGSKFTLILENVKRESERYVVQDYLELSDDKIEFESAKILIVDDEISNRELLKGYLDEFKFSIYEAENGLIAIKVAEEVKPDFIFMDLRMPVLDGYESTRRIKETKSLTHIPIVVLSASNIGSEKSSSINKYINGYLMKPISKSNIIKELQKNLKYRTIKKSINKSVVNNDLNEEVYHIDIKVLEALNNELMKDWESFKRRKPQDDLRKFSNKLIIMGKDNKVRIIEDFGIDLLNSANLFDIASINKKLNEFPMMVKRFS